MSSKRSIDNREVLSGLSGFGLNTSDRWLAAGKDLSFEGANTPKG